MRRIKRILSLLPLLLLLVAIALPFLADASLLTLAFYALLFAAAASAWNLFSGYTGYISLGHVTFYGLGAYTLALLCQWWNVPGGYVPFLMLPLAGLVAAIFALPLGWLALSSKRYTFVVITIAILFIFQLLAYNLDGITNGSRGMYLPIPPWEGDSYGVPFFYVTLALLLLTVGVSWWIRSSKYGLGLLAIRDDEERASSLGIKTERYKLVAYVISAFLIGMVGGMDGYFVGFISPAFAFAPVFDVTIALMTLFGGAATLWGPLLGGLLLEPLQQFLTLQLDIPGLDLIVFGGLLLIVILVLPSGIFPTLQKYRLARQEQLKSRENVHSIYLDATTQEIGAGDV